jgi:hypothetical protein
MIAIFAMVNLFSAGTDRDQHLAGARELLAVLELLQCLLDLLPGLVFLGVRQAAEHLVQSTEGFLLELEAFGRTGEPHGGVYLFDSDVAEAGIRKGLFQHLRLAEAEGSGG